MSSLKRMNPNPQRPIHRTTAIYMSLYVVDRLDPSSMTRAPIYPIYVCFMFSLRPPYYILLRS